MRPVVVLAHYNCFTNKACLPQQVQEMVELPNGKKVKRPVLNDDGTIKMRIPKCADLMTKHWDMVIVDEAHRIKNHDAQWTRNLKKLKTPYRHIMTGTGFVNNPSEIWSLLNFVWPKEFTSYWKFREYFCEEDDWSGYRKVVGIKPRVEDEFRELVRKVGVRRTMIECFPDIAEPIETVVPVGLSPIQTKMYIETLEHLYTLDAKGTPLHSPGVLAMLTRLRQITAATPEVIGDEWNDDLGRRVIKIKLIEPSSKLDAAMEVIEGLEWDDERRDQVVVFSAFKEPLDLLHARLDKKGISVLHMKSEMNEKQRFALWNKDGPWWKKEYQVFLSTLDLGAESINLASAHRAIFLDQLWSPAKNKQAIGRVYRPGQTGAVQLIYIRAENTVDYRVLGAVKEKHGWFQQIFGSQTEDTDDAENGSEDGE